MKPAKEICFAQDTEERRKWFKAASFSHPAKMVLGLQIYLIEHYTLPGETILDPMAGSGTVLVGCALGRNVICVELEAKFIKMIEANWQKIKSLGPMLGYKMGEATILQGDARNLQDLLVDKIVTSPPYAEAQEGGGLCKNPPKSQLTPGRRARWKQQGYQQKDESPDNISSLPYGEISAVISSPPYAGTEAQLSADKVADPEKFAEISSKRFKQGKKKGHFASKEAILKSMEKRQKGCGENPNNISKLPYADAVITSPPYEETISGKELRQSEKLIGRQSGKHKWGKHLRLGDSQLHTYSAAEENIGNLKSENYLEAMLQVYRQCHKVLKDGGLLCLVVKNFIRDKKIVRLDLDTIKLCEKAGFVLKERLKRRLTSMSFWRIIYHQKYPDVDKIEHEDILVFQK